MSAIANLIDFASDFSDLVQDQAEWSRKVFGPDDVRGPVGPLKHMMKELDIEIISWIEGFIEGAGGHSDLAEQEYVKKEFADLLILYLDAMRRAGFKMHTIVKAAIEKMEENKKREWPPFDPAKVNEAVEHIRK